MPVVNIPITTLTVTAPLPVFGAGLTRIIHEDFYCNHQYAAAIILTAGGLAALSVNILFQICFLPSRLRVSVSRGVSAISSRTLVNNAGYGSPGCAITGAPAQGSSPILLMRRASSAGISILICSASGEIEQEECPNYTCD